MRANGAYWVALLGIWPPDGEFWVTAHNPPVRRQTIDGTWHQLGENRSADGTLELRVFGRYELDPESEIVTGTQRYEVQRDGAREPDRELGVSFHLISPARLEILLRDSGFVIEETYGD